jgi:crossover junction endodeoxyribonuclease RuvC
MIFLGIDPGLADTGYGVVRKEKNDTYCVAYGVIKTDKVAEHSERLTQVSRKLEKLIKKYKPAAVAVEELFFFKNAKTAFKVGEARGVVLLTAKKSGTAILELTPLQVKQGVTGYGRAEKIQVQKMIQQILKLKTMPRPDDAADALAVAYTAAQSYIPKL